MNNNQPQGKNSIKNIAGARLPRYAIIKICKNLVPAIFVIFLIVYSRIGHAPLRALTDPCADQKLNRHKAGRIFGWSARIRTMIKRTKISCPTIRRRSKNRSYYTWLCNFCNKNFIYLIFFLKKSKFFSI